MDIDSLLEGLSYLLEYVLLYLMLPGQIENWIIIVDLNYMGLFNLPISVFFFMGVLKKNIGFFNRISKKC